MSDVWRTNYYIKSDVFFNDDGDGGSIVCWVTAHEFDWQDNVLSNEVVFEGSEAELAVWFLEKVSSNSSVFMQTSAF